MREITNNDDIIDSRDVIERIEELRAFHDDAPIGGDDGWNDEMAEELRLLEAFASDGENDAEDWHHGACLIRDSYFETYARELAEDIHGHAIRDASWPFTSIDWEAAANDLLVDYTSIEFDGVTYYVR